MRVGWNTRAVLAHLVEFGLIAALSLAPFLWRVLAGAGDLPAGDAWAYERIFDTYHTTGDVRLVGWNDITLVGMLPITSAWVAIAGYGHHQLHLLGSVMCAVALVGVRSLLVTFGISRRLPALLLFGGFSGFVGIAGTYLSDSFAVAGAVWAVALVCKVAYPRDGAPRQWAATAAVIGAAISASFGFLVRQQMAVGAIAAGWLLLGSQRPSRSRQQLGWFALFCATFLAISLPIYLWRAGLEHGGAISFELHPRGILSSLEALFIAQGLLLFAAILWVRPVRNFNRRGILIVLGIAVVEFALLATTWSGVAPAHALLLGIQEQYGLDGGGVVFIALLAAATTGWIWTWRAWRDWHLRERHPLTDVALLGLVVELVVIAAIGAYWTRYSLFTVAAALVVVMARPLQRSVSAFVVAGLLLLTSFWELDHSITPTDAIKEAARITTCMGIAPEHLDATFSWDGRYYTGIASVSHDTPPPDGLPISQDWATLPEMKRDAVLTPHNPGTNDTWLLVGPIHTTGLIPTTEQDWWLTIRRSAITTDNQAACLER